jgi:transcriptional regulator with XRE-family HTH domain
VDDRKRQKILDQFGKKVREAREKRGLSTRGLADLADIDYANFNRIENGLREPKLSMIITIANALGVDPSDLLK